MNSQMLILKSGRCSWGRCIFCGYGRISGYAATSERVTSDFKKFFDEIDKDTDVVKVFGSGSFFDERQVPLESRRYFTRECKKKNLAAIIESRPDFVKDLGDFSGLDFTIAIGLEVADDAGLDKVKKGFHLDDFERAAKTIHEAGGKVRSYLLVNLPFENDLDKSVEYALKHSDSVVLINLLPHGNTPVFRDWLNGEWNFLTKEEFAKAVEKWSGNPSVEFDAETFRFVPKFPKELQNDLAGVGEEYLTHPYFEVWQDYLCRWYKADKGTALFLPCAHHKPYSQSRTHQNIIRVLRETGAFGKIHEVMLSNAGVIPREFEDMYPFNAYDWDERLETPEIKNRYIEVTKKRIMNYLAAQKYKRVYCFLKYDSESYKALEAACGELGIGFENLLARETYEKIKNEKSPMQSEAALEDLRGRLMETAMGD